MSLVKKTLMSAAGGQGSFWALYSDESTDTGGYWILDGGTTVSDGEYVYYQHNGYQQSGSGDRIYGGYYPWIHKLDLDGNIIWEYLYSQGTNQSQDYNPNECNTLLLSDDKTKLYFEVYDDSYDQHVVTCLNTSDGSVVWSKAVKSDGDIAGRVSLFKDSAKDIILTAGVSSQNSSNKGRNYFWKFNKNTGATTAYYGGNSALVSDLGNATLAYSPSTEPNPTYGSTLLIGTGIAGTTKCYMMHTKFTGNSGSTIISNNNSYRVDSQALSSVSYFRQGGATWYSANKALFWGSVPSGTSTYGPRLMLFTTNSGGGTLTYQDSVVGSVSATPGGNVVVDNNGDIHAWMYGGNNGGYILKFGLSGNTLTTNAMMQITGSGVNFRLMQHLSVDDYGGLYVAGRTGGSGYNGFLLRMPQAWDTQKPNTFSAGGVNVSFTYQNNQISNTDYGNDFANSRTGWHGSDAYTFSNISNNAYFPLARRSDNNISPNPYPYLTNIE